MRLVTGDKCAGMLGALEEVFPGARYQRCTVHFYRNVLGRVPVTRRKAVARMLKAIHAQESREACSCVPSSKNRQIRLSNFDTLMLTASGRAGAVAAGPPAA